MPDFSDTFDPYASPIEVPEPLAKLEAPFPGGLKAICIIAIVLGSLGAMAALLSGVGLVVGQQAQAALNPSQPGTSAEMEELQQKMQTEINAIANKYIVANTAAALMHLFTAVLLLSGAIMTLRRTALGASLLTFGSAASILYVVGYGILNILIQLQTVPVIESFMGELVAETGEQAGQNADALAMMPKFLMIGVFIALAFSVLFALVKITFYLITIFYLRKPQIRALFQTENGIVGNDL